MKSLALAFTLAFLSTTNTASAGEIRWGSCIKDNTALCPVNVSNGSCRVNFYMNDIEGETKFRFAIEGETCYDTLKGSGFRLAIGAQAFYYTLKATPCWRCH